VLPDPRFLSAPERIFEHRRLETSVNEPVVGRPKQFLADLATAMRSTAEAASRTIVEQSQANAEAYAVEVRERAGSEIAGLRKAAADDVAVIRDQSKTEMQRVSEQGERLIVRRQQDLELELAEYDAALAFGLAHVKELVDEFEAQLSRSFDELVEEADPTIFASLAAQMPDLPDFGEPNPAGLVRQLRARSAAPAPRSAIPEQRPAASAAVEPETAVAAAPELPAEAAPKPAALPDHWWLDSAATLAAMTGSPARH
jgi:hypothetical protein